ncbi:DsbA family protein [Bermanella sp. R86510]|uniref:DsbA family protein n=1 Tax=unclassified Bermanella TaxID=2627862 RepID=UPI0037CB0F29
MAISSLVMPHVAAFISSPFWRNRKRSWHRVKRALLRRPPTITVFIHINDPYSYLLLQVLPSFMRRFHLKLVVKPILQRKQEMFPEPEMWQAYALEDAQQLAELYDLKQPHAILLSDEQIQLASQKLLEKGDNIVEMMKVYESCYEQALGSDQSIANPVTQLYENQALLERLGHYASAMIYFDGEWFWGLDRLDHLERCLNSQGLNASVANVNFDKTYAHLFGKKAPQPENFSLDFYWSARSPYSYIALQRTIELAHFHKIELNIKPVLPMVMRDLPVPTPKKMYIFHDTKREAEKLNIDYGKVADPLGKAVENCYALVDYARKEHKLESYLISFANAVNNEGIRAHSNSGLKYIVERCGLNWEEAQNYLNGRQWAHWADHNLQDLYSLGLWGVPSYHLKNKQGDDVIAWGQDRLWRLEKVLLDESDKSKTA